MGQVPSSTTVMPDAELNKAHAILIAAITLALALAVACAAASISLGDVANADCLAQGAACQWRHSGAYVVIVVVFCAGEALIAGLAHLGLVLAGRRRRC